MANDFNNNQANEIDRAVYQLAEVFVGMIDAKFARRKKRSRLSELRNNKYEKTNPKKEG